MTDSSAARKAALWVGLVFLLGAALGGVLGYVFAHGSYASTSAPVTDQAKRAHRVQQLTQELDLNSSQQQQVDRIIADIQTEFRDIRKQSDPQINEARQRGRDRIRAILTSEQKPKFEAFLQRLDEERKRNASH
jgi:flagellar basal body-associated protein FliL